jgi:hypothetical protein
MQKGTSGMSQIFGGPSALSRQPSKNDPNYPDGEEIFSGLKMTSYPFSYLPQFPPQEEFMSIFSGGLFGLGG